MTTINYFVQVKIKVLNSTWEELKNKGGGNASKGARLIFSDKPPKFTNRTIERDTADTKQRLLMLSPAQRKNLDQWALMSGVVKAGGRANRSLYLDILLS